MGTATGGTDAPEVLVPEVDHEDDGGGVLVVVEFMFETPVVGCVDQDGAGIAPDVDPLRPLVGCCVLFVEGSDDPDE